MIDLDNLPEITTIALTAPTMTAEQALMKWTHLYGQDLAEGILSEHQSRAEEDGLVLHHARNGATWVTGPRGGKAVRLLCSEIVWIVDEDGRTDGRCGRGTIDGLYCEGHSCWA